MSPSLAIGIVSIVLALAAYTVGVVAIARGRRLTRRIAVILTLGLALDVTATACMVGISNGPLTLHGWVGLAALAIMATLVALVWRHRREQGIPPWLHRYAWAAYLLWLAAFILGVALGTSSR